MSADEQKQENVVDVSWSKRMKRNEIMLKSWKTMHNIFAHAKKCVQHMHYKKQQIIHDLCSYNTILSQFGGHSFTFSGIGNSCDINPQRSSYRKFLELHFLLQQVYFYSKAAGVLLNKVSDKNRINHKPNKCNSTWTKILCTDTELNDLQKHCKNTAVLTS